MQTNIRRNFNHSNRKYCSKCDRYGNHTESLCNESVDNVCIYCASTDHSEKKCRFLICPKCAGNHLESKCMINQRESQCIICNAFGHTEELCPNNWRIFYNVTDMNNLDNIYCPIAFKKDPICPACGNLHLYYKCPDIKHNKNELLFNYNPVIDKDKIDMIKQKYLNLMNSNLDNQLDSDPNQPSCSKELENQISNSKQTNTDVLEIASTSSSSNFDYDIDESPFLKNLYNKQSNIIRNNLKYKLSKNNNINSPINQNESNSSDDVYSNDDISTTDDEIKPFSSFDNKIKSFKLNNKFNNNQNRFFSNTKKKFKSINFPNFHNNSKSIKHSNFNNSNSNLDFFKKKNKFKSNQSKFKNNQNRFNSKSSFRPNFFSSKKK